MSLIMFMETNEGLILAGDSRLSSKVDPDWHTDDAEKIFECKNKVGIAYHGDADIKGEPIDKIIKEFIVTVSGDDKVDQILGKMQEHIKSKGNPESKFYLFGYENSENKIYRFNVQDNMVIDMSDNIHGTGGKDEIAWAVLRGKFDIHKTNEEAIKLINQIYQKTMESVDSVGGAIDILFISINNGIQWIQHK